MGEIKSFVLSRLSEKEEDPFIGFEFVEEVGSWILNIEEDIEFLFDKHKSEIEDLKKHIKSLPKKIYKKNFEKYNFNEYLIMLKVARILREKALIDKNYEDLIKWYKCINLLKIRIAKDNIDFNKDIIKKNAALFEKILQLGIYYGIDEALDISIHNYENLYEDYFHKKKSADSGLKRWAEKNELYKQAIAYAKNSWEEGEKLMHNEMIREILEMETFKDLKYDTLKKRLKPIAESYGKFYNPNEKSRKKSYLNQVFQS